MRLAAHQNLKDFQSIHNPKGWSFIQDYVGEEEIILFVNPDEEQDMWLIPSGIALTSILAETVGFPFYVASRTTEYMFSFDDHDCLIANGKARDWICQHVDSSIYKRNKCDRISTHTGCA